ncbi:fumarylacetoacetate hydrolase family protein [Alicyclobacillus dauci]|uniref:Fumarylacetoacetate hydrolase family protein n=1 Tax=Alicyclobacillus dauci TaxID=1475485 RepID=A0ABY6Z6E8_9BACL|nr:fumarylacetoacetate hydrolase family protein [Alicyclobacillus dauci]WAH38457.1 fumarylacetoacetate hydrolase family protein [Alicyclobacillus dauci]
MKSASSVKTDIRNIFCVGRNYRDHATELGNAVPTEPMIFGKFTHALEEARGTVELPSERGEIHHELEIVLYIAKQVTLESTARDVVGAIALGLDLTDRSAQSRLKEKGHPWEFAKSFVGSAVITDFYAFDDFSQVEQAKFRLEINGKSVQEGVPTDMVFDFTTLIRYTHKHFGLNQGDILFTGTPAGVGPLRDGDTCILRLNDTVVGEFHVTQSTNG